MDSIHSGCITRQREGETERERERERERQTDFIGANGVRKGARLKKRERRVDKISSVNTVYCTSALINRYQRMPRMRARQAC